MLESLTNIIPQFISSFGYIGILAVMIVNSVFIPIPTELTLPFAGFLVNQEQLSLSLVILVSILGELIGGTITYSIGHFIGEKFIINAEEKRRKFIFINKKSYQKASSWLNKYGFPVIFFAKLIPGLSTPTSLAAGIANIGYPKFILIQILASIVYNTSFVLLGFYLGSRWGYIFELVERFQIFLFAVVIILIVLYLNRKESIFKFLKKN